MQENDAFCGLFERDISSDSSWWHKRGFESHILETSFKFESIEEAQELLSFYWTLNGRKLGSKVDMEIEYKVVVFTGRSGDKSMKGTSIDHRFHR